MAAGESVSVMPDLHGWHVGSAWQRKDQPGKWACDFTSFSCGLSMGNLGFLTTWWPSSKGKHPKGARRHCPYLTVQVTRCHFNHPRFIEAVTKSIQFLGRGHRSQDSTEREQAQIVRRMHRTEDIVVAIFRNDNRRYCCNYLWKRQSTSLTNHRKLRRRN